MKSKLFGVLAGMSIGAFAAQPAAALSFTFFTPAGSTCGGEACAAEAVITTNAGSISVTLTDLLTPTQVRSAGQALSDLQFTLSNAPGTQGALTASGQLANIGAGGTVTNVSGSPVRFIGEGPPPPGGSGTFTVTGNTILMEAIGGGQPSQMILPSGGSFTNANAYITGGQCQSFHYRTRDLYSQFLRGHSRDHSHRRDVFLRDRTRLFHSWCACARPHRRRGTSRSSGSLRWSCRFGAPPS
jgi:hypothetical protein